MPHDFLTSRGSLGRWHHYALHCARATHARLSHTSWQFVEQRLGLLEVRRGESLSEPAVGLSQKPSSDVAPVLALPKFTQAQHRPQLQRLGLLAPGDIEGLKKTGFCC